MSNRRFFPGCLLALLLCLGQARAQSTSVRVVYPKPGQVVHAIDSTFIFGNVSGDFSHKEDWLDINGHIVEVHPDGGFLAFLPVTPGDFSFNVRALRRTELPLSGEPLERYRLLDEERVAVSIPVPRRTLPDDTLQIIGDYRPPDGDLVLSSGDRLDVMFQGTPGLFAWFSIPGVVDSVPMSETEPRQQPYWGEAVFGVGAVPDSVLIGGIYSGYYRVPESISVVGARIVYNLATPPKKYIRPLIATASPDNPEDRRLLNLVAMPEGLARSSGYRVSLNHPGYPVTVRFLDSAQTLRYGPRLGYFSIFQPQGVEALAVGREGDWFRLQLSHTQFAWANVNSVIPLAPGVMPPRSQLAAVRTYGFDDHVLVEFALSAKHPFRVYEDDRRTLRVQLFGVTSNTDWIRYESEEPLIELATWAQPEDGLYEIKLDLSRDLWGYDTYYEGNTFYLKLLKSPKRVGKLWGKTVVVDPGHSSDPGAIGPTGLTEADANLGIAIALERELKREGATVVMTRSDMSHVPLYDRPTIAKLADADLFVSVHNNALPDGVNPFESNGVSAYYYHPHSIDLARAIQGAMLKATGAPDFGLYHGNLAVNRPTQYPAVLIECAFMMLPDREAKLKTDRFRRKIATAVTEGIEKYLEAYDRRNR